jgi:hypothetical protein
MDPRTGLGDEERREILPPPGLELRSLGRPARSQSLYRLSYRVGRRLNTPQSRSRRCGVEVNNFLYWESNPGRPALPAVSAPTYFMMMQSSWFLCDYDNKENYLTA